MHTHTHTHTRTHTRTQALTLPLDAPPSLLMASAGVMAIIQAGSITSSNTELPRLANLYRWGGEEGSVGWSVGWKSEGKKEDCEGWSAEDAGFKKRSSSSSLPLSLLCFSLCL